jgi:outer membrane cobalamin receptor
MALGALGATVTGFFRKASNLISLFGNTDDQTYQNVYGARSLGVEAAAVWTSPGGYLSLDGNATYQDFRNDSPGGQFGAFDGDRIPNHPYLFASGTARFTLHDVAFAGDELVATFGSRYVHSFFRSWESVGRRDLKQTIPSQLIHSLGVGYLWRGERLRVSTTAEVANLTDEEAFDFYGAERPGRAFYLKTALDF